MAKGLQVPPELEHLIEKREQETDRRQHKQRTGSDQRQVNLGPVGSISSAKDVEDVPMEERRAGGERRQTKDRRKKPRRKT
jgi:hypothetical protein